jgi:hypothetical protein
MTLTTTVDTKLTGALFLGGEDKEPSILECLRNAPKLVMEKLVLKTSDARALEVAEFSLMQESARVKPPLSRMDAKGTTVPSIVLPT